MTTFCANGELCRNPKTRPTRLRGPRAVAGGTCSYCSDAVLRPAGIDTSEVPSPPSEAAQPRVTLAIEPDMVTDSEVAAPRNAPADAELSVPNLSTPATTDDVERRILAVGEALALAQMGREDVEDFTGFSNADYQLGWLLAATGRGTEMALLLRRYPRQAGERGVSREELDSYVERRLANGGGAEDWAAVTSFDAERADAATADLPARAVSGSPTGRGSYMRTLGDEALQATRRELRGRIALVQDPHAPATDARLVGLGIPGDVLRLFKALGGRRDNLGWLLPRNRLGLIRQTLPPGMLVPADAVDAAIQATPQDMINPHGARLRPPKDDGSEIVIRIKVRTPQGLALDWNAPFSPNGTTTREIIKGAGGRFDRDSTAWGLTTTQAVAAKEALEAHDWCDASALPGPEALSEAEAEEVAEIAFERESGQMIVSARRKEGDELIVLVGTRRYNESFKQVCRELGAKWNPEERAYEIPAARVPKFLERLDSEESLNLTKLLPFARELAKEQSGRAANELRRIAALEASVPRETPSGRKLLDHQIKGVAFLLAAGSAAKVSGTLEHPSGAILADDMGLGKTLQAIIAAQIKYPNRTQRKLVVCPATAKLNWRAEFVKWLGDDVASRVHVLQGRSDKIPDGAEYVIVNYDILKNHRESLLDFKASLAILDEAHVLRNHGTQRSEALLGKEGLFKKTDGEAAEPEIKPGILSVTDEVWCLTGTPVMSKPRNLLNLLMTLRHPLARSPGKFIYRYDHPYLGAQNLDELGTKIGDCYLRRMKEEVLDLPPKHHIDVELEMDKETARIYDEAVSRLDSGDAKAEIEILTALKVATARAKTPHTVARAREVLESSPTAKVIVFSEYHDTLDALQAEFGDAAVRLDGSVSSARRQELVNRFQNDPNTRIFIGQTIAAGNAITLTAARDVIFNDLDWVPANMDQAEDRAYRIGQTGSVLVHRMLLHGSLDPHLLDINYGKRRIVKAVEGAASAAAEDGEAQKSTMRAVADALRGAMRERAKDREARDRLDGKKRSILQKRAN